MRLTQKLKNRYFLSDHGASIIRHGILWTVIVNLVDMVGIAFLFVLVQDLVGALDGSAEVPGPIPLLPFLVLYLLASLITHALQYRATYTAVYGEVASLRMRIGERLLRLPLGFFGKRDLADLAETVMGDAAKLEHVWSHVLGYLGGSLISTVIIAVILFIFDWRLALASLWSIPVAFSLLGLTRAWSESKQKQAKEASLTLSSSLQEMLENVQELRAAGREDDYLGKVHREIDSFESETSGSELVSGLITNSSSAVLRLGMATTVLAGASLIAFGEISFMTFFAYLLVITRIYAPFDQSLALVSELFSSHIASERLQSIEREPVTCGKGTFSPQGHSVEFSNVSFSYGDKPVLDGISFIAEEGQITALVGPSGSGKSTCARLAARLWDPQSGVIRVGGVDIGGVDPEEFLASCSMVFQDVVLFDDTVMENIRMGKRGATDEEVRAAAHAAECDEFVCRLPHGYETKIGENGTRLSGGQRQRVSIARALLKNAPILLLDEATASLDVESETKVQAALSRLVHGKTVLAIAHRMRTIASADKVVVLEKGKVVEQGVPSELVADEDSRFGRMCALQNGSKWGMRANDVALSE